MIEKKILIFLLSLNLVLCQKRLTDFVAPEVVYN